MKILKHFERINAPTYILYRLRKGEWSNFVGKLPVDFRQCYISNELLEELSAKVGILKSEFLKKYTIPDEPIIKSGDFGELLCYHAAIESFENKGILLFAPLKWRWKDSRNVAAPGSDAMLFYLPDIAKPSKKDMLVTLESKMKSVNSNAHRIQDAIDGATKDKKTRMVKTLSWIEEKFAKLGEEDKRRIVERFKDPATHGDFQKQFKAIAIIDNGFEADEIAKPFTNTENVTVIIFSVQELKKAYEDTMANIITSV